jgi:hypothetical protein
MDGVAELVTEDVAHEVRREEEELLVDADRAAAGVASPTAALVPHPDTGVAKSCLGADFL